MPTISDFIHSAANGRTKRAHLPPALLPELTDPRQFGKDSEDKALQP